ncbi:hypothetical protein DYB32_000474 [Aphanomyces invadans]|uniref:Uncharacterized protein n=1 Tax=Aphanomyces invadans TaxID=157072 RepID=A0A3R7D7E4_9STRA|nr:hypothetical protein DYB32_000474 [Aphanomyces invadans]
MTPTSTGTFCFPRKCNEVCQTDSLQRPSGANSEFNKAEDGCTMRYTNLNHTFCSSDARWARTPPPAASTRPWNAKPRKSTRKRWAKSASNCINSKDLNERRMLHRATW